MIKEHLINHLNIRKLYNAYLIHTDDIKASLDEIQDFVQNKLLSTNALDIIEHNADYLCIDSSMSKTQNISIEQMRQMQLFISQTSIISNKKIIIINEADKMNLHAANACLKMLEEPPINTYLFLITENANRLLPTIRSRCAKIQAYYHLNDHQSQYNHNIKHYAVDAQFVTPLLHTTNIEDRLKFFRRFTLKEKQELWHGFTEYLEYLFTKFCRKTINTQCDIKLSEIEKQLFNQLQNHNILSVYNILKKSQHIIKQTNEFDLNLHTNVILLVENIIVNSCHTS